MQLRYSPTSPYVRKITATIFDFPTRIGATVGQGWRVGTGNSLDVRRCSRLSPRSDNLTL